MEKLLSNPVTLRLGEEVCSSIRGSEIASHYPEGVAALSGLPEGARRAVEQKVVEDLSFVDRRSALEFVLLHSAAIRSTDQCMQGVFNDAWFLQNSEQVSVLIRDAPPSGRRDFLIGEMVRAMAATLPKEAEAWVEAITSPELKQNAMNSLRASPAQ